MLGTTLSHFRITAALGQGGMGEVYRATDTRLDREVAVKVLPEELAADPERLARFDREAKILAALDHPNIASIWGLEEAGGRQLLVMQLAEGETLAERIERGPLPLSKVLAIALQVTDALESAHEQGIIHRDLKPANVMVNPDGQVKLLDFGLARAIEADSGIEPTDTEQVLTQSPTVSQPMTNAGTLLGTAAYMSPEQARGEAADERADIWSFGCLLFEMLTGHLLFAGPTMSDILAAILRQEPDWDSLPSSCPPALRRLLSRCLAKEKSQRLRHIADARLELLDASRRPAEAAPPTDTHKRIPARVMVIALMLAAAVAGAGIYSQVARLAAPGAGTGPAAMPRFRAISFDRGYVHSAHFTPDGTTVLYGAAFKGEPVRVYSTRTDGTALQSRLLEWPSADVAGISDTGDVALLLDRHHVGSWLRVGSLAQVPLSGGSPRIIQNEVYAADISPDGSEFAIVTATATEQQLEFPIGSVVFRTTGWISHPRISPDGSRVAFLDHPFWGDDIGYVALARAGGDAERLEPTLHNGLQGVAWSPSGEEVWYTSGSPSALWSIRPGEPPRVLHRSPSAVRIQDTAPSGEYLVTNDPSRAELAGRLAGDEEDRLYSWWGEDTAGGIAEDGSVFAGANSYQQLNREYRVHFRRAGREPPVRLGTGSVGGMTADGKWVFAMLMTRDRDQLQLYPTGPGQVRTIDLDGIVPSLSGARNVSSSRDSRRITFVGSEKGSGERVWVLDLDGGSPRPVTGEGIHNALLSPDGKRVAVGSRETGLSIYPVDGGDAQPVPGTHANEVIAAWSSDQRSILVWDQTFPATVHRVDLETGAREPMRTIEPGDPAGILYGSLVMTTDGRYYLLRFRRTHSQLYHVTPVQ